ASGEATIAGDADQRGDLPIHAALSLELLTRLFEFALCHRLTGELTNQCAVEERPSVFRPLALERLEDGEHPRAPGRVPVGRQAAIGLEGPRVRFPLAQAFLHRRDCPPSGERPEAEDHPCERGGGLERCRNSSLRLGAGTYRNRNPMWLRCPRMALVETRELR